MLLRKAIPLHCLNATATCPSAFLKSAASVGFVPAYSKPPLSSEAGPIHSTDFFVFERSQTGTLRASTACASCNCLYTRLVQAGIPIVSVTVERDVPLQRTLVPSVSSSPGNMTRSPSARSICAINRHRRSAPELLGASALWQAGYTGKGIRVAVLDTGIDVHHEDFRLIKSRSDWTSESVFKDVHGHGTYVSGVIASTDSRCMGVAPDAEIHMLRVFAKDQSSFTSWFLNAFNHAIRLGVHILNLSIGGPDYMDEPFVHKVNELSASGVTMVSAIGNDGPMYGTLNNPADQPDVIGVGGLSRSGQLATFSSRGMSAWEVPSGYGRSKPDVIAPAQDIAGPRISGGCRSLSGTSVASPIVAGAAALLASILPAEKRLHAGAVNPAALKQALVEGARPIDGAHMFEQGAGAIDLIASKRIMEEYVPRASALPSTIDLADGYYWWPLSKQPLYRYGMPTVVNVTLLNAMNATGEIVAGPSFTPSKPLAEQCLTVEFQYSRLLWPWCGYLAVFLSVSCDIQNAGIAEGSIAVEIASATSNAESIQSRQRSKIVIPVRARLRSTPPRKQRILWDQFHSIRYPPAYVPRDNLNAHGEALDWHGDHPHTNFHELFDALVGSGYFVEVLGAPFTCFDALQYGALMIVDPEEEYSAAEIHKLKRDVEDNGMGMLIFAEWYNGAVMDELRFFDSNTQKYWYPSTGGANIPAINELLDPFGIAFSDQIFDGSFQLQGREIQYRTGTSIRKFPSGGEIVFAELERIDRLPERKHASYRSRRVGRGSIDHNRRSDRGNMERAPVMGRLAFGTGRIFVFGDTTCLDSASHSPGKCFELCKQAVEITSTHNSTGSYSSQNGDFTGNALFAGAMHLSTHAYHDGTASGPVRKNKSDLAYFSKVQNDAGNRHKACTLGTLEGIKHNEKHDTRVFRKNGSIVRTSGSDTHQTNNQSSVASLPFWTWHKRTAQTQQMRRVARMAVWVIVSAVLFALVVFAKKAFKRVRAVSQSGRDRSILFNV